MRVVVIGGTGHIGTYLVPRLVFLGHEVTVVSRGIHNPYTNQEIWKEISQLRIDRLAAEKDDLFGEKIKALRPDAVFDMTCFSLESAVQLVDALRGSVDFFVHCGTIWVRGYSAEIPATEDQPRNPISDYGRRKNAVENYMLKEARHFRFPATIIHPGHIVGPGWVPIGPTACHDLEAIGRLLRGESVILPNLGMETLHHVHADDVAQGFIKAFNRWSHSIGESFFIVSPSAMTMRGFAEGLAGRFGIKANLNFQPFDAWTLTLPVEFQESGASHVLHSSNASISKAVNLLGYAPRYSTLDAVEESVRWLIEQKKIIL